MDLTKEILEILNSDVKEFEGQAKVLALFADGFEDKAKELNDLFALHVVSQQRELLIDFVTWQTYSSNLGITIEDRVDIYLKQKGN
jgi:hypothetical protein